MGRRSTHLAMVNNMEGQSTVFNGDVSGKVYLEMIRHANTGDL